MAVLTSAIAELPADYRVVELLRDVDGLSHQEIAETLGLSVVNVRKRVHRARLFLRKRLEAHFRAQTSRVRRASRDRPQSDLVPLIPFVISTAAAMLGGRRLGPARHTTGRSFYDLAGG